MSDAGSLPGRSASSFLISVRLTLIGGEQIQAHSRAREAAVELHSPRWGWPFVGPRAPKGYLHFRTFHGTVRRYFHAYALE